MEADSTARHERPVDIGWFFGILLARKGWIVASFVAAISMALVYLLVATPRYEARATLQIGQVGGSGLFESPERLALRLLAMYGRNAADGVIREHPFLKRAVALRSIPGAVELVAEGETPEGAATFLKEVYVSVEQIHDKLYRENRDLLVEQVQSIQERKGELEGQYKQATATFDTLRKSAGVSEGSQDLQETDALLQASLIIERSRIASALTELAAEKPSVALRLAPPQTQPTVLTSAIVPPRTPVAPRKVLLLAIAGVIGLLGGATLAVIVHALDQAKEVRLQR